MSPDEKQVVANAIDTLQKLLHINVQEFPKAMYHPDKPARTVKTPAEQETLETEGWSTLHDPDSGPEPRAYPQTQAENAPPVPPAPTAEYGQAFKPEPIVQTKVPVKIS